MPRLGCKRFIQRRPLAGWMADWLVDWPRQSQTKSLGHWIHLKVTCVIAKTVRLSVGLVTSQDRKCVSLMCSHCSHSVNCSFLSER